MVTAAFMYWVLYQVRSNGNARMTQTGSTCHELHEQHQHGYEAEVHLPVDN